MPTAPSTGSLPSFEAAVGAVESPGHPIDWQQDQGDWQQDDTAFGSTVSGNGHDSPPGSTKREHGSTDSPATQSQKLHTDSRQDPATIELFDTATTGVVSSQKLPQPEQQQHTGEPPGAEYVSADVAGTSSDLAVAKNGDSPRTALSTASNTAEGEAHPDMLPSLARPAAAVSDTSNTASMEASTTETEAQTHTAPQPATQAASGESAQSPTHAVASHTALIQGSSADVGESGSPGSAPVLTSWAAATDLSKGIESQETSAAVQTTKGHDHKAAILTTQQDSNAAIPAPGQPSTAAIPTAGPPSKAAVPAAGQDSKAAIPTARQETKAQAAAVAEAIRRAAQAAQLPQSAMPGLLNLINLNPSSAEQPTHDPWSCIAPASLCAGLGLDPECPGKQLLIVKRHSHPTPSSALRHFILYSSN